MTRARDLADFANKDISGTLTLDDITLSGAVTATGAITSANNVVQESNSIRSVMGNDGGSSVYGTSTNHAVKMFTNNANVATFLSSGGLTFNGDTAVANALNDYEEGTWTGTLVGTTSNPTTSVTATGYYVKIGEKVSCTIQFTNVNTTGAAGSARVNGLPFTSNRVWVGGNVMFYAGFNIASITGNIAPYHPGDQQVSFYQSSDSAGWGEVTHDAKSGVYLWFTLEYAVSLS